MANLSNKPLRSGNSNKPLRSKMIDDYAKWMQTDFSKLDQEKVLAKLAGNKWIMILKCDNCLLTHHKFINLRSEVPSFDSRFNITDRCPYCSYKEQFVDIDKL